MSFWKKFQKKGEQLFRFVRLAALVTLLGFIVFYFLGSEGYFRCRNLNISGLEALQREKVVAALPPILGENLLLLPLSHIQRQLETLKLVETAAVSRVFPHELKVTITERTPAAVAVVDGQSWAVDYEGVVLYPFRSSQLKDPIFVTGLSADDEANGYKIKWAVRLLNRLHAYSKSAAVVSEINVANSEAVKLFAFAQGTEIRLDRNYYEKNKWDYLISFLEKRSFAPEKLAYLDLRFQDIVVRPL